MQQLSDPSTRRLKIRTAILTAVVATGVLSWTCWSNIGDFDWLFVVIPIVAGAFVVTVRRQFWYIADDVSHDGQFLIARRGAITASIRVDEIEDVYAINAFSREGIAISLRSDVTPFGRKIVFLPPDWKKLAGEGMDRIAADIKLRLRNARA